MGSFTSPRIMNIEGLWDGAYAFSLFINLAYWKDISKVWSGSLTPGRVLSRVYRYLFYMSNNMMDEQNTAGEKNLFVLILQFCLLPDTKIKQKCSDPCLTHYTHDSIILWNGFKTMNMLWFKFSFGAKLFKLVQFLFSFVVYSLP